MQLAVRRLAEAQCAELYDMKFHRTSAKRTWVCAGDHDRAKSPRTKTKRMSEVELQLTGHRLSLNKRVKPFLTITQGQHE